MTTLANDPNATELVNDILIEQQRSNDLLENIVQLLQTRTQRYPFHLERADAPEPTLPRLAWRSQNQTRTVRESGKGHRNVRRTQCADRHH